MPTVLFMLGWRLFFYSNEGDEPIHIHARKGDAECKFWLRIPEYDIEEEYFRDASPQLRREIRRIIFSHFELIVESWNQYFAE